jgi:pilus assembly protein CpaE
MKTETRVRVVVVGSAGCQIEEVLRESGAHVSSESIDDLPAVGRPGVPQPDAVIVDLRGRQSLSPALMSLKRQHPAIGVVIVASALDPALMLEAMRAGVNEWVAEPVTAMALVSAVQRVTAQHAPSTSEGRVFAVVGAKGGVGTTTVAVNVAAALARVAPRRSLLMDLHLAHGDAALFLGIEPRFTTADVLANIHRLDEAYLRGVVATSGGGLQVLGSAERGAAPVASAEPVRGMIEFAARHYEYVVLDVPRSDLTMLDSLDRATTIILVVNQELATVRRAGALALALRQRYGKERIALVINRFDRSADIGREDVERVTGGAVRHVIPSDYRLALEGLNKGRPVVVENHNRLAASLSSLARNLAGLETARPEKAERTASFLGRLGIARS